VVERSPRRALGVTVEGVPVELVIAEPDRFGTALVRATGSPEYAAALEPLPEAPDEEGVYRALGLPFVPPELREGEFRGEPPRLLELAEVRGDLHTHTDLTDGIVSLEGMIAAAEARVAGLLDGELARRLQTIPGGGPVGFFEPIHGSAPDIAGQGVANPIACILSFAMCLRYSLSRRDDAKLLEQAVERCLRPGPAGIFLSGGLDSVSVAAMATDVARKSGARDPLALSIVFPTDDANEEDVQRGVAGGLGLEHVGIGLDHNGYPRQSFWESVLAIPRCTASTR